MNFAIRLLRRFYNRFLPSSMKFRFKALQCAWCPRPMMSQEEVSFFNSLLATGEISRVVEFGAGGSTLYFPKRLPSGGSWTSIEAHPGWAEQVRKHVDERVSLYQAETVDEVEPGFMDALHQADLVLVDGSEDRSRILDLVRAENPAAMVVLHDSWRDSYQSAAQRYDRVIKVSRPYGLGRKGPKSAGGMTLLLQDVGGELESVG